MFNFYDTNKLKIMDFNMWWIGGMVLFVGLLMAWNNWRSNRDREIFFRDLTAKPKTEK